MRWSDFSVVTPSFVSPLTRTFFQDIDARIALEEEERKAQSKEYTVDDQLVGLEEIAKAFETMASERKGQLDRFMRLEALASSIPNPSDAVIQGVDKEEFEPEIEPGEP